MSFPLQVIEEGLAPAIREVDLRGPSLEDRDAKVNSILRDTAECPFDLERGPLLRVSWVTLSAGRGLLMLALPALCSDRRGLELLATEIGRSYAARARGEPFDDEPPQFAILPKG